jgi:hypothetical protein
VSETRFETVPYGGWPNGARLTNGRIELVATTDVGPRVIRLGFVGGPNLFKEFPEHLGRTGGDEWRSYGGHRLWHAPESVPRTYWPDNVPVESVWRDGVLTLSQPTEGSTGLRKAIALRMAPNRDQVTVTHTITNEGLWPVELSVWCLSVMAPGGTGIFPQEVYKPHAEALLPARPLVLWHYTDMADPRWTWGTRYVRLRQDPSLESFQKVGMMNTLGWAAYQLESALFLKRFRHRPGARYPDMGCNTETFTNADMLEVETLGPLVTLAPGESATHVEDWFLFEASVGTTEADLDERLLPLVAETDRHLGGT